MANKIIYDINGKIKEIATTHMSASDDGNSLFINKLSFNTASVNLPNGLLIVGANGNISSSAGTRDGDIVSWNVASGSWIVKPDEINISTLTASSGDLYPNESYNNIRVKSLSNVSSGTLGVANGGTGIAKEDIIALGSTDEALLVGNETLPMVMIKKSDQGDLSKKPVLTTNSSADGWTYLTQSTLQTNIDVQIFTSSATWSKPQNTKMMRIIAAGGGGGGGSGANRHGIINALGGTGGGGGQIIDTGVVLIDDQNTSMNIIIGQGGLGGSFALTNSSGISGAPGGDTYVYVNSELVITASGGGAGAGGSVNSTVTSSGGAGGSSGVKKLYDTIIYNSSDSLTNGYSGVNNSITTLDSTNMYATSNPGGGSGGGLSSTSVVNYRGGSSIPDSWTTTVIPTKFQFDGNTKNSYSAGSLTNFNVTFDSSIKKFGTHSAYFNGTNSYLEGGGSNFPAFPYYAELSYFECWVRPEEIINNMTLWEFAENNLRLRILSSGKIEFRVLTATLISNKSIEAGKWSHISISGASGRTLRLFVNGNLEASVSFGSGNYDGYTGFNLGRSRSGTEYFKGHIDQFMMFRNIGFSVTASFIPSPIAYELNGGTTSSLNATTVGSASLLDYYNISNANISNNSQAFDMFRYSSGPGGASSRITETFDIGTYALYHANLNNPRSDSSIYRQSILSGSASGTKIISTGSLSIPQLSGSGWDDGVVSSSYFQQTAGTASSLYISPGYNAGTGPWSLESWFYLNNAGTSGVTGINAASCYLFGAGYSGGSVGALLAVSSSAGFPKLRIWSNNVLNATTSSVNVPINEWCHIVLQKSGSNMQAYINGTSSINIALAPTVNGTFGYSLGATTAALQGGYNFNGYAKELRHLNRAQTPTEIAQNYNNVITNVSGPYNDISFINEYPGGTGGDGAWGSGGGGGGTSTNITGSLVGTRQGGNGGDGYVAIISYKDF